jgi:hypothetical protein
LIVELSHIVAFSVIGTLQLAVGFVVFRQQRSLSRLTTRMSNIVAGISLLTDTTETGLRDVAAEIARAGNAEAPRPRPRAATQRRMATAARRGVSVQEIAAAEQVSEGEVNLRLQLAESTSRRKKAPVAVAADQGLA